MEMATFKRPFHWTFRFIIVLILCATCKLLMEAPSLQITVPRESEKVMSTLLVPSKPVDVEYSKDQVDAQIREYFSQGRHTLCLDLTKYNQTFLDMFRVHYRLDCQDLFDQSRSGTGNWLSFFYGLRQAARLLGNVQLEMVCTDAMESRQKLILPWIMGTWGASPTPDLNWDSACQSQWDGSLLDDLRYELRRMAIALVGVPNGNHAARNFILDPAREEKLQLPMPITPLWQNIELDEVALHFRCGDILEGVPHKKYGYSRFHTVADLIDASTVSIGIVTQPFHSHSGQARAIDKPIHGRCAILVDALQSTLQQRFPQAVVSVRNSPDETIALAYARFIMAKQAIAAGTSTFVTMPFRATFGTAHTAAEISKLINSVQIFDLWKEEGGQEQILNLFNSQGPA